MSVRIEKKGFIKSFSGITKTGSEEKGFIYKQEVVLHIPEVKNSIDVVVQRPEYYKFDIMNHKFVVGPEHLNKPIDVTLWLRTFTWTDRESKEQRYGMSLSCSEFKVIQLEVKQDPNIANPTGEVSTHTVAEQLQMPIGLVDTSDEFKPAALDSLARAKDSNVFSKKNAAQASSKESVTTDEKADDLPF